MVHRNVNLIFEIYRSPQSVFTLKELAVLIGETDEDRLKSKVNYHIKKGRMIALRRGIYAKEKYNPLELANKIFVPSYISLETVLQEAGVNFQYYKTIFVVSYLSREIKINDHIVRYRKIQDRILSHPLGIRQENGYAIATPERAFLDALYIYKTYHFDKLDGLNVDLVFSLIQNVYTSEKIRERAEKLLGRKNV